MILACGIEILSVASIKKMVVLEKSKRKMFGQVRDPLMKPTWSANDSFTYNSDRKSIGVVGTIDPRKSIDLAVQALEHLGPKFHLKLSGEVTPEYSKDLEILMNQNPKIHLDNRHLSEKEIVEAISSLSCFLVLLQGNLPSGTILRSLSLGVPVVVGGAKVLQKVVAAYPDLAVWTELNPEAIAQSVAKAVQMARIPALGLPTPSDFSEDLLEN
jgi:glycosyltransferase involved in cell wall biosynthesis